MEFRRLGQTDIRVSAVALGVMTFGSKTSQQDAFRQLDMATAAGINFFDTAENYPAPVLAGTQGRSEEILGGWIASRGVRQRVIVATKVAGPGNSAGDMTHIRGAERRLDRANIVAVTSSASLVQKYSLMCLTFPSRGVNTMQYWLQYDLPLASDGVAIELDDHPVAFSGDGVDGRAQPGGHQLIEYIDRADDAIVVTNAGKFAEALGQCGCVRRETGCCRCRVAPAHCFDKSYDDLLVLLAHGDLSLFY